MKLLVTGGAGFIGSNFVHHVLDTTDHTVVVLDKLTYAGNRASLAGLPADRFELVVGDITDAPLVDRLVGEADAVVHYAAESHNDNSLHDPRPFLDTNIIGTYTLIEAARRHGTRFHHISTDEVYGDLELDDPNRFTEQTPYNPSSPYSLDQGRVRPARPRLGPLLRAAGHDLELLQQLRPLPARREVHPPPDHQRPRRGPPQALRRRAQRPRLDPRLRPLPRRPHHPRDTGVIGETYLIGADGEEDNKTVVELILELTGSPPTPTTTSPTAPATTSATRSTPPSSAPSSAGSPPTATSGPASPPPSTGTARTRTGGAPRRPPPKPGTRSRARPDDRESRTREAGALANGEAVLAPFDSTSGATSGVLTPCSGRRTIHAVHHGRDQGALA